MNLILHPSLYFFLRSRFTTSSCTYAMSRSMKTESGRRRFPSALLVSSTASPSAEAASSSFASHLANFHTASPLSLSTKFSKSIKGRIIPTAKATNRAMSITRCAKEKEERHERERDAYERCFLLPGALNATKLKRCAFEIKRAVVCNDQPRVPRAGRASGRTVSHFVYNRSPTWSAVLIYVDSELLSVSTSASCSFSSTSFEEANLYGDTRGRGRRAYRVQHGER